MIALWIGIGGAFAEQPVDLDALPPSVVATLAREWPGAVPRAAERDGEGYEVTIDVGPRRLEVAFGADGAWTEAEEKVAAGDLPVAVRSAAAAHGKVLGAEQESTPDGRLTWDVVVRADGKALELHFDERGTPVQDDDDEDEDEDDDD